jgi:Tfp pilus assembly protein PilP
MEENDLKFARNRPPGLRGLLIAQLTLKGVVRDGATHKMIAVVTNRSNRAYFLREGEAVYDGVVNKITPDAVYFLENVVDGKREAHSRQVVKTLNPATGEVQ